MKILEQKRTSNQKHCSNLIYSISISLYTLPYMLPNMDINYSR